MAYMPRFPAAPCQAVNIGTHYHDSVSRDLRSSCFRSTKASSDGQIAVPMLSMRTVYQVYQSATMYNTTPRIKITHVRSTGQSNQSAGHYGDDPANSMSGSDSHFGEILFRISVRQRLFASRQKYLRMMGVGNSGHAFYRGGLSSEAMVEDWEMGQRRHIGTEGVTRDAN